jgi:hypothetical protein
MRHLPPPLFVRQLAQEVLRLGAHGSAPLQQLRQAAPGRRISPLLTPMPPTQNTFTEDKDVVTAEPTNGTVADPVINPFVNPVQPNRFIPTILAIAQNRRSTVAVGAMLFGCLWLLPLYYAPSANYLFRKTLETQFVIFFTGGFLHFFASARRPWVSFLVLLCLPFAFVVGCLLYIWHIGGTINRSDVSVPSIFLAIILILGVLLYFAHRLGRKH